MRSLQTHPTFTRRTLLLGLVGSVAELTGCGGGSDVAGLSSGGTGSFTSGTISGLGSIIVNGVRFEDIVRGGALAGQAYGQQDKGRWFMKGSSLCVSWEKWTKGQAHCGQITQQGGWYVAKNGEGEMLKFRRTDLAQNSGRALRILLLIVFFNTIFRSNIYKTKNTYCAVHYKAASTLSSFAELKLQYLVDCRNKGIEV